MSKPYFIPPEPKIQNTPWRGKDAGAMALAFERAFCLTVFCAWCGALLRGPADNTPERTSHGGICPGCLAAQVAQIEAAR